MCGIRILTAIIVLSVTSLFFLISVNVGYLQRGNKAKELCSLITDELKFCTDKQKLVVTPKDSLILNFAFTNISNQEMYVNTSDMGNYIFKVTDENEEIISTKLEQKIKNSLMSDEEQKNFAINLTGNSRSTLIQPNEVHNEKISLDSIYDFTRAGKYYVEVTKRTRNPNGEGEIMGDDADGKSVSCKYSDITLDKIRKLAHP